MKSLVLKVRRRKKLGDDLNWFVAWSKIQAMNLGKYVFSQLTDFLSQRIFNRKSSNSCMNWLLTPAWFFRLYREKEVYFHPYISITGNAGPLINFLYRNSLNKQLLCKSARAKTYFKYRNWTREGNTDLNWFRWLKNLQILMNLFYGSGVCLWVFEIISSYWE